MMNTIELKLEGQDNFFVQEVYKFIRTNIQFCGDDIKTIAVTSCNENEGKSTSAIYIAKAFAELGKKVLLIDADMRKSVLAGRNFKVSVGAGLSEFLSGQVKDANNLVYQTSVPNLRVILAGTYPPNPAELLNSKNFEGLIQASREAFNYVIIDTPPLGAVTDAAIIASKCDGTVLVIGGKKLDRTEALDVVSQLRSSGTRMLGAIRNHVGENKGKSVFSFLDKNKFAFLKRKKKSAK